MASNINPDNIDGTFPIERINNDSQGFRTNFTNTISNLQVAKDEIEDLQSKSILKEALAGEGSADNTLTIPLNTAASDTSAAGLNIAEGVAPTAPVDGDVWVTAAGELFVRLNGSTVDLIADLGEFTVAGLPAASSNSNRYALATDASGGRTIVRSDGTNWKIVVVEGATVT